MYIRNLVVDHLKLLKHVELDFTRDDEPRMWTVLLGPNGVCKTTLLQAIGLVASGAVRAKSLLTNVSSLRDLREPDASVGIYAEFGFSARQHPYRDYPGIERPKHPPIVYEKLWVFPKTADFNEHAESSGYWEGNISDGDSGRRGITTRGRAISSARSQQLHLWFAAGYGVNRTLPIPMSVREPDDLALMRMQPLFDQGTIIGTGFSDLFQDDDMARAYAKALRRVLIEGERLLPRINRIDLRGRAGVRRAQHLIESHRFDFDIGGDEIRVPAVWLSLGYQSTIAWLSDLIGQVFWEAGGPIEPEDMEGLVLVDELDLHLHPSWQRVLIRALKASFPRMQFVVTTHSPLLLTGLEADEIVLLGIGDDGSVHAHHPRVSPAYKTGNELLSTFFGIDHYLPDGLDDVLLDYARLAGDPHRSDEDDQAMHALRQQLEAAGIGAMEPIDREAVDDGEGDE